MTELTWELKGHTRLLGIQVIGMPVEEILFALAFGMYWAGVYEHFTWRAVDELETQPQPERAASS